MALSLLFDVEVNDKDEVTQAIAAGSNAITLEGNELNPVTRCLRGRVSGKETVPARDGHGRSQTESILRECASTGQWSPQLHGIHAHFCYSSD
jgi:hypothetical protein